MRIDRIVLAEDLLDSRGEVIARRGAIISAETVREAAGRPGPERLSVRGTPLAEALVEPLHDPTYAPLFPAAAARDAVEEVLLAVALPPALLEELAALRAANPELHRHGAVTAAVVVRTVLATMGRAHALPDLAAAALLHDLGMRHLPPRVLDGRERLGRADELAVARHTLLGAYELAKALGAHPAVAAARSHHWRCGQGYPGLGAPPARTIELVAIASAFAALTQPRGFRSRPYDLRGAVDVLVAEAAGGWADRTSLRLLVRAIRGGAGSAAELRFGRAREGHAPEVNRYVPVLAPERPAG